jgi:hypothetical protein
LRREWALGATLGESFRNESIGNRRLGRVEDGLAEIAEPQPTLRRDVQDLKASVQRLEARIDALERREDRS